jgi:hypothetical protein
MELASARMHAMASNALLKNRSTLHGTIARDVAQCNVAKLNNYMSTTSIRDLSHMNHTKIIGKRVRGVKVNDYDRCSDCSASDR